MFYREAGEFKTSYKADQATFPIRFDFWAFWGMVAVAFLVVPFLINPYWEQAIVPAVRSGRRVLISAHGNSLRALVKHLDRISDEAIVELNIPTGIPLVYELNDDLTPRRSYYLGDEEAVRRAAQKVADQLKK